MDVFKPIKPPKRTPKPAPPIREPEGKLDTRTMGALRVIRRLLKSMRWDDQGGYSSRHEGRWMFFSTGLGQVSPKELDALFEFAGITPDEIDIVGDCTDCANSDNGYERGYSAPCVTCLRPSHINGFVPLSKVKNRNAVTDAEIRKYLERPDITRDARVLAKIALDEGTTHRTKKQLDDARKKIAHIIAVDASKTEQAGESVRK